MSNKLQKLSKSFAGQSLVRKGDCVQMTLKEGTIWMCRKIENLDSKVIQAVRDFYLPEHDCENGFSDVNCILIHFDKNWQVASALTFKEGSGARKDFVEIYDVCTATKFRGAGFSARALYFLIGLCSLGVDFWTGAIAKNYILWLGVKLTNLKVLKLYTSLGFVRPLLTKTSALGVNYDFYFISLIHKNETTLEEKEDALFQAKVIAEYQEQLLLAETKDLFLDPKVMESPVILKNLQTERFEVGGELEIKQTLLGNMLVIKNVKTGPVGRKYTVDITPAPYVYHTHPLMAHVEYLAGIGCPSIPDFMFSLEHPNVILHLIFSIDGIYSIYYTGFFKRLLHYTYEFFPKCFNDIKELWGIYLGNQQFRFVKTIVTKLGRPDLIDNFQDCNSLIVDLLKDPLFQSILPSLVFEYVNHINSCTLKKLITFSPTADNNISPFELKKKQEAVKTCYKTYTTDLSQLICSLFFIGQDELEKYTISNKLIPIKIVYA